jgi:hypothetical protein
MPDTVMNEAPPPAFQNRSSEIAELATALSAAQGAFGPIERNREVEVKTEKGYTYTFKYATMDAVMSAVQPALSANGLAIVHQTIGAKLISTLFHSSGQWLASEWPLSSGDARNKMQAIGSAQTYGQRYNVRLLLNLASEEDDDGNEADGNTIQKKKDYKPSAGSAGAGTQFRPEGRRPTNNYTDDARHDGTLDETRKKGEMPGARNAVLRSRAEKCIAFMKDANTTPEAAKAYWLEREDPIAEIEATLPEEYYLMLDAYNLALERKPNV